MSRIVIESVQLDNCTDEPTGNENIFPSKTTHDPLQAHHRHRSTPREGLVDQTLHTLWQTRMQVRRYPRPWSQVLSVGQLSRPQTGTGICASEISRSTRGVSQQLSDGQADSRRDLEHQSRTATTENYGVKTSHGYLIGLLYVVRNHRLRDHRSEHASTVVGRTVGRNRHMGGEQ